MKIKSNFTGLKYPMEEAIIRSMSAYYSDYSFYPTALKGCRGIVFTHGVRMGGRREVVCPGCISETLRCRKFILGRDIGWGV